MSELLRGRELSTHAFTQYGNNAWLYNGIHDLETHAIELEAQLRAAEESNGKLREALEAIIRRVALVSPYYEMARAALASAPTQGEGITEGAVKPLYYVYSKDDAYKGHMNGCIVWWREKGHGYTNRLDDAGVFTDEDKDLNYPPPRNCHYIPVELARAVAKTSTHVWHDNFLDKSKESTHAD